MNKQQKEQRIIEAMNDPQVQKLSDYQRQKVQEFLSGYCDLFTMADYYYYVRETGLPLEWFMKHADFYDDPATALEMRAEEGEWDTVNFLSNFV